jgi:hypothetical protein
MHTLKSISSCVSILAEGFIEKTDHKLPGPKGLTGINGPIIGFTIAAGAFSFGCTVVEFALMADFSKDEKRRKGVCKNICLQFVESRLTCLTSSLISAGK